MADKLLRSIKFPTLPDRYVIGDSTLTEEGAAAEAKAVGDALATKADTKGTYEDLIVGGAEQLMSDEYETDKEPYLFRPTGGSADVGNREYLDSIVGGTVAWNQLVSESATSVTVQSGYKYIAKIGGAWSVAASSGSAISVTGGTDILIDLTALFNPTIADYIYSLEQSQAGAGVAWFRNYFPNDYYPYDPGTLRSVEGVSAHETVGFNQFDKDAVKTSAGNYILNDNGIQIADNTSSYFTEATPVLPNTTYYTTGKASNGLQRLYYFDKSDTFISRTSPFGANGATFTTPNNCYYLRYQYVRAYLNVNEWCINFHYDGERDGDYEPYVKHTYPLDSSLTLRGVPKLVDGKLAFDGDVYPPSGEVQRRYGIVDLGTLDWRYSLQYTRFSATVNDKKPYVSAGDYANLICSAYPFDGAAGLGGDMVDKTIVNRASATDNQIVIKDTAYTDAVSFKAAMSGVYLLYELATPTTETADGYEQYQRCDPSGTEEFVTDSIVPVGHETRYPHDLKKKIETAPDSPSTDGTYLMKRSGGKNTYMALPSTPSANGAYVLTVTVSGGTASYSWTAKG